jgi:CDP-6-deoxy-D-xylo-4-hexulose-3-dehydrase
MAGETEAFEAEIATYHGRKHAIAINSGSSANLIAVAALLESGQFTRGEGATVPAIAWTTTYAPLVQLGFAPLQIVDVDNTWNAHYPAGVGQELVVACSILGNPSAELQQLEARYTGHGYGKRDFLGMIEDNCESLGARTAEGRLTGTFGDLSTGSGFYSHQLSAIELGWVLTDNDELAHLCRLLRNHGNDGWASDDFERKYNFTVFGYNVRPIETHCAVAREQLKKLDQMNEVRRRNVIHFQLLAGDGLVKHQKMSEGAAPFGLAFEVESRERRRALALALRAAGIDCRPPTGGSFTRHPYGAPWRDQPTPNADRIHDCGLFLGNAPFLIPDKIEAVVKVMRSML